MTKLENINTNRFFLILGTLLFILWGCKNNCKKETIDGFWISEDRIDMLFIIDDILVNNLVGLQCKYRIKYEGGDYYWLNNCFNHEMAYDTELEKYLIKKTSENNLLVFYNKDEAPYKYMPFEVASCDCKVKSAFISFSETDRIWERSEILIDIGEKTIIKNKREIKINQNIDWIKSFCFSSISMEREDIIVPIPGVGIPDINLVIVYENGTEEDYSFHGLITAPPHVQALLMYIVGISYSLP
jgi:hypothetical protein